MSLSGKENDDNGGGGGDNNSKNNTKTSKNQAEDSSSSNQHPHPHHPRHYDYKWEVLVRTAIAVTVGNVLSIVPLPHIIPPGMSFLVGVLVVSLAMSLSTLLCTIPQSYPLILTVVTFDLVAATALLCCVTVSDGLFVAVFVLYAFFMTGLFFGKMYQLTANFTNMFISVTCLLSLSYRPLVKNGITSPPFPTTAAMQQGPEGIMRAAAAAQPPNAFTPLIDYMCQQQYAELHPNQAAADTGECNLDPWTFFGATNSTNNDAATTATTWLYEVDPDVSTFYAGQTVELTYSEDFDTFQIHIPGGMHMVRALWTESGTTNPLAGMRNFLIAFCWGMLITTIATLLPPIRNTKFFLMEGVIPDALANACKMMKLWSKGALSEAQNDTMKLYQRHCTTDWITISNINASTLLFEPRLCRAPFEILTQQLKGLLEETDAVIQSTLILGLATERLHDDSDPNATQRLATATSNIETSIRLLTSKHLQKDELNEIATLQKEEYYDQSSYLLYRSQKLLGACVDWVRAWRFYEGYPSSWTKKLKNLLTIFSPWLLVPMIPMLTMIGTIGVILRPKLWNWRPVCYCLKLTTGYAILFAMTVYWEQYGSFAIQVDQDVPVGSVYSGWHLLAYAFSWTPTVEGTVKKGTQRILGTAAGGFSAWLGLIICRGTYDDNAPINPYGLVVWLLFTTFAAGYYGTDPGIVAFQGASKDHGLSGMYFAMTQTLLMLEVYQGASSSNNLVVNRTVSCVSGVAMVVLLSMIPPYVKGGDPAHARNYLSSLTEAFNSLTNQIIEGDKGLSGTSADTFLNTFLKEADKQKKQTLFVYNDAVKLKWFPIYRVDERLLPILEELQSTQSLLERLAQYASDLAKDPEHVEDWSCSVAAIKEASSGSNDGSSSSPSFCFLNRHRAHGVFIAYQAVAIGLKESSRKLDGFSEQSSSDSPVMGKDETSYLIEI